MSRRLLIGLLIGATLFGASRGVLAQSSESPCLELEAEAAGSGEPVLIEHEGVRGMFFPMAGARFILCQIRELELRRSEISIMGREASALGLQIELTERQLELANEAREHISEALERSEERAREAEDRVDAWYRSPFLWFTVGAVVTVALFIGAAYAVGSLNFAR